MTLEILNTLGKPYDLTFEGRKTKVSYGTLAIDGHSILNGKFYSDIKWLHQFKAKIEKYFPQFCDLKASEVMAHPDLLIFKAYIKHQVDWYHKPFYRTSPIFFDFSYNPEHYFNYSIPKEAIAS